MKTTTSIEQFKHVKNVHTLGPVGTNCELAAKHWIKNNELSDVKIHLHSSLEIALDSVLEDINNSVLLGCIVYPDLHSIVFNNLQNLSLVDVFIKNTFQMMLAKKRETKIIKTISSHPAPSSLVAGYNVILTTSNSQAALECISGNTDACITTEPCVHLNNLEVLENFGEVPMGFSIHGRKN